MKLLIKTRLLALLCVVALLATAAGCAQANKKITINVWHYYNGPQQSAFSSLVTQYNDTVGREKGVTVVASAQGNVSQLTDKVLNAAAGKGVDTVPNIFAAYSDTALDADKLGLLAPLDSYLTAEQLSAYIPAYLDEGRFDAEGTLKIFPIAKSTELLYLNQTFWEPFAAATGATYDDLATLEGLTATAAKYYQWSNGKAFFGRDSMANYMFIGAKQLGIDLLQPNGNGGGEAKLDATVLRRLWDNFYIPYISGHFDHLGKFRNDDIKTGDIIAFVGSTSAAAFMPNLVVDASNTTHNIEVVALPPPQFDGGDNYAVQQGAGMVVTKSNSYIEGACVDFLYWLTQPAQNLQFATNSGYMPVTKLASTEAEFQKYADADDTMHGMSTAIGIAEAAHMYTPKVFEKGNDARKVLENSLIDCAKQARHDLEVMVATGVSRDQAVVQLSQPASFDAWLQSLTDELAAALD